MKIRNDVRKKIISGYYSSGQLLPGEAEFCAIYKASKMTVKHAMDGLVEEGLIVKRRGSGTFVKELNHSEMENLQSVNQFQGTTDSFPNDEVSSVILTFEVITASEELIEHLKISKFAQVYHVKRLRNVDGHPYVIENTFMPAAIVEDLTLKICQGSIYKYIEEELKLSIGSSHRKMQARKASQAESDILEIPAGDPIIYSSQIGFLTDGRPFEYSETIHRADLFSFETVLMKKK
ncbi:GntR family transcriptional regulator [Lactococcus fujiensis JCM 16395]|uniref:GntR family transcriptional regulator n=1 Tax=Lactococcus fujiensis JCM 16395 TaxID=1291764 RepID=A0A2A5RIU0_9LACT|nr:GntR family transcriptional regulator [Lactococcus fujiensis JCM 16395]